jgi:hypothetical protein
MSGANSLSVLFLCTCTEWTGRNSIFYRFSYSVRLHERTGTDSLGRYLQFFVSVHQNFAPVYWDTKSFCVIRHKHSKSGHLSVQVQHTSLSIATERPAIIWIQLPFQSIPASVSAWEKRPEDEYDRTTSFGTEVNPLKHRGPYIYRLLYNMKFCTWPYNACVRFVRVP